MLALACLLLCLSCTEAWHLTPRCRSVAQVKGLHSYLHESSTKIRCPRRVELRAKSGTGTANIDEKGDDKEQYDAHMARDMMPVNRIGLIALNREGDNAFSAQTPLHQLQIPNTNSMPPRPGPEVLNLWIHVAHSDELKPGKSLKVDLMGTSICLFRTDSGRVEAISDICVHRGASLSTGWVEGDSVVCPYHGFAFNGRGSLTFMPGADDKPTNLRPPCTVSYAVQEVGGWISIFPEEARVGALNEFLIPPYSPPEAFDPNYRSIGGRVTINADVESNIENVLDLLHISYVHSFGNMQQPLPFKIEMQEHFDDPNHLLGSSTVRFHYNAGPIAFSKVVGQQKVVVVENEFHLPYTASIRVKFGDSIKTIQACMVPEAENKCTLLWKLHRNFMSSSWDAGANMFGDLLFRQLMSITLNEDKWILESLHDGYQKGYVNSKFDKQGIAYRKAKTAFEEGVKAREDAHKRVQYQMELLQLAQMTSRGLVADVKIQARIKHLIAGLEQLFRNGQERAKHGENMGWANNRFFNPLGSPNSYFEEYEAFEPSSKFDESKSTSGETPSSEPANQNDGHGRRLEEKKKGSLNDLMSLLGNDLSSLFDAFNATAQDVSKKLRSIPRRGSKRSNNDIKGDLINLEGGSWNLEYILSSDYAGTDAASADTSPITYTEIPIPTPALTVEARAREGSVYREALDRSLGVSVRGDIEPWLSEGELSMTEAQRRQGKLKAVGGERLLFDFKETGRPLWADVEESTQTVERIANTDAFKVVNSAKYKGWLGLQCEVELEAMVVPSPSSLTRKDLSFKSVTVNINGLKVVFPHLDVLAPQGWFETTYVDDVMRIVRGNKGSVFVLTRRRDSADVNLGPE